MKNESKFPDLIIYLKYAEKFNQEKVGLLKELQKLESECSNHDDLINETIEMPQTSLQCGLPGLIMIESEYKIGCSHWVCGIIRKRTLFEPKK
jgi:hypothetical protein